MTGLFVTLEGVEGSGKTTQAKLLCEGLRSRGTNTVLLREPGGTPIAEAVRTILLQPAEPMADQTELLLFLAARAQNTYARIRPALEQGIVVVCDRYSDSTMSYQGRARGLGVTTVRELDAFATGGLTPDITFLLDLPAEVGLARQHVRNRMEEEELSFHAAVREGYLAEARRDPGRVVVVDALRPVDMIHAQLTASVVHELGRRTTVAHHGCATSGGL